MYAFPVEMSADSSRRCATSCATVQSCDPPRPLTHRELTLATPGAAKVNEGNLSLASSLFETFTVDPRTPHRLHLHRGSVGRSDLTRTTSGPLHGCRSSRSPDCYLLHSQDWPTERPLEIQVQRRSIPLLCRCLGRSAGIAPQQRVPTDLCSPLLPPFGP
jgi:hypothetical protein